MVRMYGLLAWACGSLAVALLAVGMLGVPTQAVWADEVAVPIAGCAGQSTCSSGCTIKAGGSCEADSTCSLTTSGCEDCHCKLVDDETACNCQQ